MRIKTKKQIGNSRGYYIIADFEVPNGEERGTSDEHIDLAEEVIVVCRYEMLTKSEIETITGILNTSIDRCVEDSNDE
jgi:septum formation inhibitor-activating ATPase MinD